MEDQGDAGMGLFIGRPDFRQRLLKGGGGEDVQLDAVGFGPAAGREEQKQKFIDLDSSDKED